MLTPWTGKCASNPLKTQLRKSGRTFINQVEEPLSYFCFVFVLFLLISEIFEERTF